MNVYGIIILCALAGEYLLNFVADLLNLRSLRPDVPPEFADVYDSDTYEKSLSYTRARTLFGLTASGFMLAVTLGFWFSGGFDALDRIVRGWGLGFPWTGLVYIGILTLARSVISLPFGIWSTFVIEQRFGFNKTTPATYAADLLKGALLSVVIGGGMVAGVLVLFEWAGPDAWLACWGFGTAVVLVIQYVAPVYLMPLFNKFTPLDDGELKEKILDYASKIGFPLQGIYVMDGSKRSSKSNAFFTGFGKNKRIALFDTLISRHTVPELLAVLAHEIGHYKKKHIRTGMILSVLHMGVVLYIFSTFISHRPLFDAFYMGEMSVYAGMIFFGMLFAPIEFFAGLLMQMVSRKNEFEADRFAAETLGGGEDLIFALKKLSSHNLSNLTPHPAYIFLHYSHPPVLQRIRELKAV
jgi:STE24 endopeptidase